MASQRGFSRRGFIGAGAGIVGAAAFANAPAAARGGAGPPGHGGGGGGGHGGGRIVPRGQLGVQQWAVRDSITRLDKSVSGYLGGRNFPKDATDLGPLMPLPGGFAAVFEYLADTATAASSSSASTRAPTARSRPGDPPGARPRRARVRRQPPGRPRPDDRPRLSRGADPDREAPRAQDDRHRGQPGRPDDRPALGLAALRPEANTVGAALSAAG